MLRKVGYLPAHILAVIDVDQRLISAVDTAGGKKSLQKGLRKNNADIQMARFDSASGFMESVY